MLVELRDQKGQVEQNENLTTSLYISTASAFQNLGCMQIEAAGENAVALHFVSEILDWVSATERHRHLRHVLV